MDKLTWRARSISYLLTALVLFLMSIRAGHHHQPWVPWCLAGAAFLLLGIFKKAPRN